MKEQILSSDIIRRLPSANDVWQGMDIKRQASGFNKKRVGSMLRNLFIKKNLWKATIFSAFCANRTMSDLSKGENWVAYNYIPYSISKMKIPLNCIQIEHSNYCHTHNHTNTDHTHTDLVWSIFCGYEWSALRWCQMGFSSLLWSSSAAPGHSVDHYTHQQGATLPSLS